MFQRISRNPGTKNVLSILKTNTMNKEKIIDGIITFGIGATIIILIVLACVIFDIAPEVKEYIFNL